MSTKEAYKQKIQAELDIAQAKLAELKARAHAVAADSRVEYAKQVEQLEHTIASGKSKLSELAAANEDAWAHLKESADQAWHSLRTGVRNATARFKDYL